MIQRVGSLIEDCALVMVESSMDEGDEKYKDADV